MSESPSPSQGAAPAVPLRILVAEDNQINQEVVSRMLARLGCDVEVVDDGQQAVRAVAAGRYDGVVMDVQMPALNGLDATRQIRREVAPADLPYIIALTARASSKDREACLAAGMDAYLSKPIRLAELDEAITGLRQARIG